MSPSTLTLRRGQSADYEVTIVNNVGAAGPVAVRGADLDQHQGPRPGYGLRRPQSDRGQGRHVRCADSVVLGERRVRARPASTCASATPASTSASAHGLVPATLTPGQRRPGPGPGLRARPTVSDTQHSSPLTGAQVFRVAHSPGAAAAGVDLDVYVFDPDGGRWRRVGAADTDEIVTIDNARLNGTWTVFVHGWLIAGPPVPLTTRCLVGRSRHSAGRRHLVITSEPRRGLPRHEGTSTVSWTGATAGEWHLGAVRHNGPAGSFLGLTLVEVDNRPARPACEPAPRGRGAPSGAHLFCLISARAQQSMVTTSMALNIGPIWQIETMSSMPPCRGR